MQHKVEIRNSGTTYTTVYVDDIHITNVTGYSVSQIAGELPEITLNLGAGSDISVFAEVEFVTQEVEELKQEIKRLEKENKVLKKIVS